MVTELKTIFEGEYRGIKQEERKGNDGKPFFVDVLVLDMDLETREITCKRDMAEEMKKDRKKGDLMAVEVLLRHFQSGIGISLIKVISASTPKAGK